MSQPRAIAAQQVTQVLSKGRAFDGSLTTRLDDARDRGLVREIVYGTLRHYPQLAASIDPLLKKPLSKKDFDIYALLLTGIYQLQHMQTPAHAVINSSVNATRTLKKPWAKGLVNAVLRNWLRRVDENDNPSARQALDDASTHCHPAWLYQHIKQSWPAQSEQIVAYNNSPPPMTLRVDARQHNSSEYLQRLTEAGIDGTLNLVNENAITLAQAASVQELPGFDQGAVSVQDAGAQWAAQLLELQPGLRLLDACAAPGGKAIHALQQESTIELVALDQQEHRLQKLARDLHRCKLQATLHTADANATNSWWDGQAFDRILIDAPCSGTGVISHHPDIKWLRRKGDLQKFADQQRALLNSLWPLLKPGGKLLYCTCSIMPEENDGVIEAFIASNSDAKLDTLELPAFIKTRFGYQLLPNPHKNGGFFYARISKQTKL